MDILGKLIESRKQSIKKLDATIKGLDDLAKSSPNGRLYEAALKANRDRRERLAEELKGFEDEVKRRNPELPLKGR